MLAFIDQGVVPSSTAIRVWLSELKARGFASVRTGAVSDSGADLLTRQGFVVLQTLHLLDMSLVGWHPSETPTVRTRRMRERERDAAARVDLAAFGEAWAIDRRGIDETCEATPAFRARVVDRPEGDRLSGFAVTGRAGHTGYLQRLSVHPDQQGEGIGQALTVDSLQWMKRRRLTRAVVNTHTDNEVALHLYSKVGFRLMPQDLAVLTRRLDDV
jgi:ribosomal protein S18 acetylase RimI-like enzyme